MTAVYFGTETFTVKKQQAAKEGSILTFDVSNNDSEYILINLYNANTSKRQIVALSNLLKLLKEFDANEKQLILAEDFNFFFDSKVDGLGKNATLTKKSLAKIIECKRTYDLCNIWRVRYKKSKRFTFVQKRSKTFRILFKNL